MSWYGFSFTSITELWTSASWFCSSPRERCSTMPAPRESPSTLVVVRKRSLERQKKNLLKQGKEVKTETFSAYLPWKTLAGFLICHPALCINNLSGFGTSGLSEALQWHLGWHNPRPIPIKLTFRRNSQEPIHSDDQCNVLCGQSHWCQYNHHGNQASLRDACCSNAGSSCRDTEWAVGGMERRVKTFNKRKQTNSTCGGSSRVRK